MPLRGTFGLEPQLLAAAAAFPLVVAIEPNSLNDDDSASITVSFGGCSNNNNSKQFTITTTQWKMMCEMCVSQQLRSFLFLLLLFLID
jgi:hypothetical protein